jgi:hypothetical protein
MPTQVDNRLHGTRGRPAGSRRGAAPRASNSRNPGGSGKRAALRGRERLPFLRYPHHFVSSGRIPSSMFYPACSDGASAVLIEFLGSIRVSRVVFGVSPKMFFQRDAGRCTRGRVRSPELLGKLLFPFDSSRRVNLRERLQERCPVISSCLPVAAEAQRAKRLIRRITHRGQDMRRFFGPARAR